MSEKQLCSKFGLIGDNLELKQNITIFFDEKGKISELAYEDPDSVINFDEEKENLLVIPSLINSHVHIGDSFAKERGFNKELIDVVSPPNGIKHQLLKETPITEKAKGIKCAIEEMISNGISYFIDFRENNIEGIELLKRVISGEQIKSLIFGRFNQIKEIEPIFNISDGIGLPSYHNITIDVKSELKKYKYISKKKIACHVAELNRDSNLLRQIFDDGLVDIIIHGTKLEKSDLELIKEKKISIVLCPRSNGYFGLGFPPINEILELNIPISLGTDNVMVNNLDLFEEMRYLYYIARIQMKKEKIENINAKDLLKMVTINAAKIYNLESEVGSISKGKSGDLIVINLGDSNFYTNCIDPETFFPLVVQRTNAKNIKQVYIGGKVLYERY